MNTDKHRFLRLFFSITGVLFYQALALRFNENNLRSSADSFIKMSEASNNKFITITDDGHELQARKGAILTEVTDTAIISVSRFCSWVGINNIEYV